MYAYVKKKGPITSRSTALTFSHLFSHSFFFKLCRFLSATTLNFKHNLNQLIELLFQCPKIDCWRKILVKLWSVTDHSDCCDFCSDRFFTRDVLWKVIGFRGKRGLWSCWLKSWMKHSMDFKSLVRWWGVRWWDYLLLFDGISQLKEPPEVLDLLKRTTDFIWTTNVK